MKYRVYYRTLLILILCLLLLTGCGPPNLVHTPEDVAGKTIGGLAGTPSVRLAAELGRARAYDSADTMIADLRSGQIDCIIMESTTANELVAGSTGVRILFDPLTEYDLCFAVPKENTRLLRAVNQSLELLRAAGILRGFYNKYFAGRSYNYTPLEAPEPYGGTLTVALPPDSPPLSYKDSEGRFVGMDVEVAIALGDVMGVEIIPIEYEPSELATAVWHGRADLALGWHPGEGEGIVNMSVPYANVVQVVIVRR